MTDIDAPAADGRPPRSAATVGTSAASHPGASAAGGAGPPTAGPPTAGPANTGLPNDVVPAIELAGVAKEFQARGELVAAVRGIDLAIRQGEFFSMLGPSGCGKTTTMRMVA